MWVSRPSATNSEAKSNGRRVCDIRKGKSARARIERASAPKKRNHLRPVQEPRPESRRNPPTPIQQQLSQSPLRSAYWLCTSQSITHVSSTFILIPHLPSNFLSIVSKVGLTTLCFIEKVDTWKGIIRMYIERSSIEVTDVLFGNNMVGWGGWEESLCFEILL